MNESTSFFIVNSYLPEFSSCKIFFFLAFGLTPISQQNIFKNGEYLFGALIGLEDLFNIVGGVLDPASSYETEKKFPYQSANHVKCTQGCLH